MKNIFMVFILASALVTGVLKIKTLWEQSLSKAISTAIASEKIKSRNEINELNKNHSKEVRDLKNKYKKKMAKERLRGKAKAKVQRAVSAVPIIGIAAFGVFEKIEYDDWKKENPEGSFEEYTIEISSEINDILKEDYNEYYEEYKQFLSIYKNESNQLLQSTAKASVD